MKLKEEVEKKPTSNGSKTLGPITDLEHYLQNDWWKRIFNSMYLKTDGDVVEDALITTTEVDLFFKILDVKEGDTILDMACGQGRHLIEMGQRGNYNLFGIDRSRYLIQRAKNVSKKKGLDVQFKEGDIRKLPYATDTFDFVTILGNSFGYFEIQADDIKILKEIFRVLKPGGKVLMDIADGSYLRTHFTPRSWEWIDKNHFVCRERMLAKDNQRLISREVITHTEKGVIVDQFYAERLYTSEELIDLLKDAGFSDPFSNGGIEPDSIRNQDLGMMEQRFIMTANVNKEWTPKKTNQKPKKIAVLMGDPTLSDIIKPDAVFDSDDLETIEQLKVALSKLSGFQFTYYNNHRTLVNDLQKLNGDIDLVLNLCDEGFKNDAVKELHIPSLLEIFDLPYSGSNPQTLAYCYDKSLIRGIAAEIDVAVADAFLITADANLFELNIPFPVIAKPNFGDSSFGITQDNVVHNIEELSNTILRIRKQFGYSKPILVEEFLTGAELSVGIIGNLQDYKVLPVIEEDYSDLPEGLPKICGYEAKWLPDSPYMKALKSIPSTLSSDVEQKMIQDSLKLFERLDCKDYCRFDWRCNSEGEPKILEVNPNPGWCWDGHLAKMSELGGMDYSQMLESIINAAITRNKVNA